MMSVVTFLGTARSSALLALLPPLAFFTAWGTDAASTGTAPTICFYSPETNINNFCSLKAEFDTYLTARGRFQFQPFSKKTDFEAFVANRQGCVFFISSWYFRNLMKIRSVNPVLVGAVKGKPTQKRVLTAKKAVADPAALKGQRIASAGSEEYTRMLLSKMLGPERKSLVNTYKILPVPKDIDALMAVSFGMAKAALTTESSLDRLREINPKQHALLRRLAASEGTLLPVVAVPSDSGGQFEKLLAVIKGMKERSDGVKCLKMLGLDSVTELDPLQRKGLSK